MFGHWKYYELCQGVVVCQGVVLYCLIKFFIRIFFSSKAVHTSLIIPIRTHRMIKFFISWPAPARRSAEKCTGRSRWSPSGKCSQSSRWFSNPTSTIVEISACESGKKVQHAESGVHTADALHGLSLRAVVRRWPQTWGWRSTTEASHQPSFNLKSIETCFNLLCLATLHNMPLGRRQSTHFHEFDSGVGNKFAAPVK